MAFKYVDPTEKGYVKFRLTRKEHNEILPYRRKNIFSKIEAYYSPNKIRILYTTNLFGKILSFLLIPFSIILYGLSAVKEIPKEFKNLLFEKKYGRFTDEYIYSKNHFGEKSEKFIQLESIYKARKGER